LHIINDELPVEHLFVLLISKKNSDQNGFKIVYCCDILHNEAVAK